MKPATRDISDNIVTAGGARGRVLDVVLGVVIGLGAVGFVTLVDVLAQQVQANAELAFLWALAAMGVLGFAFGVFTGYFARRATVSITAALVIIAVVVTSPISPFGSAGLAPVMEWVRGDFLALVLLSGLLVGLPAARLVSANNRGGGPGPQRKTTTTT